MAPVGPPAASAGYFDHDADIGIIGRGPTVETAFERAATAVFAVITDPSAIRPLSRVEIAFDEDDLEFALVRWLNGLLSAAREEGLALAQFQLKRDGAHWAGMARGEPWRADLERGVEVKGATLTELSVARDDGNWEARCVVDV
jgi:SHS2 domain-containing protein